MVAINFTTTGAANVLRDAELLNKAAGQLGDLYKKDTTEAKKLETAAKRIYESLRTPQEQMLQKIKQIGEAQRKGLIPPREAQEAIDRLKRKMGELKTKTKESSTEVNTLGAGFTGFGIKSVLALAGSIASVSTLKQILTDTNSLLDQQAQKLQRAGGGLGRLVQLAGGSEKKRDLLIAASKKTFGEGAFRTLDEAANLTFELESAGALSQRGFFSNLQTVDDAAKIARSTALIRNNLGFAETGTLRALTSKSIAAALPATGVSPSGISVGVASAAQSGKTLGLSDEELIAAVSRVSEATGSGDLAGTQVNSLLTALIKKGFADDPVKPQLKQTREAIKKVLVRQQTAQGELTSRQNQLTKAQVAESAKDTSADRRVTDARTRLARLDSKASDEQVSNAELSLERAIADQGRQRLTLADRSQTAQAARNAASAVDIGIGTELAVLRKTERKQQSQLGQFVKGKPLGLIIEDVKKLNLSEAGLIEFFGRKEAAKAFGKLSDTSALAVRRREIEAAQRDDLAGLTITNAIGSPEIAAGRLRRRAAARLELALESQSIGELGLQSLRERKFAEQIEEGVNPLAATASKKVLDFFESFSPDLRREKGTAEVERFQQEQLKLLREGNSKQDEVIKQQQETNRKLSEGGMIVGPE